MSQKLFRFLAGAVSVLIICGAPLTYMAAADDPAKPASHCRGAASAARDLPDRPSS
jgi:hypothetical protein